MKKLFVLAGSAAQVRDFCNDYGVPTTSVIYVTDQTQIRGTQDPAFVVVGSFWQRHDAATLWTALQSQFLNTEATYPPFMIKNLTKPPAPKGGKIPKKNKGTTELDEYDTNHLSHPDTKTFKKIQTT